MSSPTTTIKNIAEITDYSVGTLMFPSDYHDSTHYYDEKALKRKYGFHPRSKVYLLTKTYDDQVDYINAKANKDNKQRYATMCPEECEGARPVDMSMFANGNTCSQAYESDYPYGDVLIFGETHDEFTQRVDKQKEEKRMKKVRKEFLQKIKNCDEKMLCMLIDRLEELEEAEEDILTPTPQGNKD